MSVLTEVLKLFKYDPATDGDMTFNLTQCLNNNWDKLDAAILLAIAAAGAYNPEESYAVGDYCTYKGKLHKCSTAIPTGETWTEAHWTTTTVAAELAELSSQLSNALRRTGNQTVDGIIASRSSIDHAAYASVTGADAGGYLEWYKSFETYYKRSQLILGPPVDDAMPQLRLSQTFDGVHFDSVMVATATPPQEFDLPLAEGFSKHYCASYCKTQDGMVTVSLWIVGSGAANVETTIATLPEGFRPTELFRAEGIVDNGTIPSQNQCGITVNEYGQIAVQAKSAWGYVSSIFTFRAAD